MTNSDRNKAKKLSTEPYKGVRDFFPEDMAIQKRIFGVWRNICEKYGYEEYGASVLEPAELYRAKTGEEIVNEQTYTFTDRGSREVTLRPEMTPTVARMVTAKRRELGLPLRWYSIPNLFRYEQPQRGRVREHWQLNVDLFGIDSIEADIEIISLAHQIMKNFGAKDEDFSIKIGDRRWLDWLAVELGDFTKTEENKKKLFRLLDTKDKDPEKYMRGLKEIDTNLTPEIVSGKGIDWEAIDKKLNLKLKQIIKRLENLSITNARIDLTTVVRGFDYYTGVVFEIFDTNPENKRSLFGGGRYDDLTSLFGGDRIPAVGFGMGDVTIRNFLETHKLLPDIKNPTEIHICTLEEKFIPNAQELAVRLRAKGINVSTNLTDRKVGDQIAWADKRGIPKIICIGDEEAKTGRFRVKDLKSGDETVTAESEFVL
ncbi:histidine--tRNA ligase [Patescibacteria group bacterium]|nr:histidine--tRNA ligase [Patescibacteria group bacterium]MDE1946353.1 histidine--tRNA ligase [Patescibacteria group bacterium]MDE2010805.1 histidine--tRNA ligase [Patescibacteria group bacterium]MDE2233262.1 histidine--tRNA ligase [Patescibacteria group bacterium]